MSQVLITTNGYEKLKAELEELRGPVRKRVADSIREAKSHGDLKENAAYHEAKLNQKRLESRIADLENILQKAKIVDRPQISENIAHLGSKVKIFDYKFDEEILVTVVGSYEADPVNDLISITSPLGEALLGKCAGDEMEVDAPGGMHKYKVLEVL
jgi:transcription elongation factor GreA